MGALLPDPTPLYPTYLQLSVPLPLGRLPGPPVTMTIGEGLTSASPLSSVFPHKDCLTCDPPGTILLPAAMSHSCFGLLASGTTDCPGSPPAASHPPPASLQRELQHPWRGPKGCWLPPAHYPLLGQAQPAACSLDLGEDWRGKAEMIRGTCPLHEGHWFSGDSGWGG